MSTSEKADLAMVERLLPFVPTDTPDTATAIWRRFANVPQGKALNSRLRRQRRVVAALLEDMAEADVILCKNGDNEGHPVPVFLRAS